MFHHWKDETDEEEKRIFIQKKAKKLREDASMLGGRYREFEDEAKEDWERKQKDKEDW